jgi:hypothetical protein
MGVADVKTTEPAMWQVDKNHDNLWPTTIQAGANSSSSQDLTNKAINNHHDD